MKLIKNIKLKEDDNSLITSDNKFEDYIRKLPIVGHPDPTGKYLLVSKEEYDNWD